MTPPVVDEKELVKAYRALNGEISIYWMRKCVEAYIVQAPQPDLLKLIAQMEGVRHEKAAYPKAAPVWKEAIDRCIALVRANL